MTPGPSLNAQQYLESLCLFREARGESQACKAAILAVIRNRAADPKNRWPKDTCKVITQPFQFSSFNQNDPNVSKFPIPGDPEFGAWVDCANVVLTPLTADPTSGANGYESLPANMPKPAWADPAKITMTLGPFRFYKL